VIQAFGGPVLLHTGDAADLTSSASAAADIDRVYAVLSALDGESPGSLRLYRPHATAAFAPRDTTLPAYAEAAAAMLHLGFTPAERRAGGQLAIYDTGALVIDLIAPHQEPRNTVKERFALLSAAIADALKCFSVDARAGQVAGEYCPGDYSVNAGGTLKLAGLAQRIGRRGYHMGAVISVEPSTAAREAVSLAYELLGFPFDPASFGAVHMLAPHASFEALRAALLGEMSRLIPIAETPPQGT
jgi:octanoyl-[GcvH]:protein N-octanoyltransferase